MENGKRKQRKFDSGLLVVCLIISVPLLYVWFLVYNNLTDPRIIGTKLQRYRNRHYGDLEAGKELKSLPEKWGEPELVVNFTDGSKLSYFAGVHANEGDLDEIKESIGKEAITHNGRNTLMAYAYFQVYTDKDGIIEAFVYGGEEVDIHTINGDIEGNHISIYLDKKYSPLN
ncbi:hypothetical protein KAR04_03685 [Candidatus Calescamantes bacterium]|nr:hypothetical protein [Candidatus Calescamantes bacterium]